MTSSSASTSVSGAIRKAGLADQLGEHSARPERDERAEDRILHEPGKQLGTAAEHRLHDDRAADPLRGGSRRPPRRARSSATPPVSVLCAPAAADLTTAGKPSSRPPATASSASSAIRSGDEREAVGAKQLPRLGGIQPGVLRDAERALDDVASSGAVDAVERGTEPERSPEPLRALGDTAERASRRLRDRRNAATAEPAAVPRDARPRS